MAKFYEVLGFLRNREREVEEGFSLELSHSIEHGDGGFWVHCGSFKFGELFLNCLSYGQFDFELATLSGEFRLAGGRVVIIDDFFCFESSLFEVSLGSERVHRGYYVEHHGRAVLSFYGRGLGDVADMFGFPLEVSDKLLSFWLRVCLLSCLYSGEYSEALGNITMVFSELVGGRKMLRLDFSGMPQEAGKDLTAFTDLIFHEAEGMMRGMGGIDLSVDYPSMLRGIFA